MKKDNLLRLSVLLFLSTITAIATAQHTNNTTPKTKPIIPFGKKLPPPENILNRGKLLLKLPGRDTNTNYMQRVESFSIGEIKKDPEAFKQRMLKNRNDVMPANSTTNSISPGVRINNGTAQNVNFHLTKDINALTESFPINVTDYRVNQTYAVLNDVIYFFADDGIHGSEFWRSDGSSAGTYMIKDIEPGPASSNPYNYTNITSINGKIYFSAYTSDYGLEPWVSDGTDSGTSLLKDIKLGNTGSYSNQFVGLGDMVYFVTDGENNYWSALWKTDGTSTGTTLVKDLGSDGLGYYISQLMVSNNLLFFTFQNQQNYTWELWKSDGTEGGTSFIGANASFAYDIPAQLTNYNNLLYFSASDGTSRKLWVTDGTNEGTTLAPGNNNVTIYADYLGVPFPILNNALYIPGISYTTYAGSLYKYDASNNKGLVQLMALDSAANPNIIIPSQMIVVDNVLYFKVTNYYNGLHDELWTSKGNTQSTRLEQKFATGETINNLTNNNGLLYFVRKNKSVGTELWTALYTSPGAILHLASDIFKGQAGSYPYDLTPFKGKLFFGATHDEKGTELFFTGGTASSTALVKDINTYSSSSSYAAYYPDWITGFGNRILFTAYENAHGYELYQSDGTAAGTSFINDIVPGDQNSYPQLFRSKGGAAYFVAYTSDTSIAIFKSDGTTAGLQKMTTDFVLYSYYLINFDVTDNGLLYYSTYNSYTGKYELWRTDGTTRGTILLTYTLYYDNMLHAVGNTAFFVAGDAAHGYELWKSNGTFASTRLVKDIYPGYGDAVPRGLVVYNNEVYFSAYNGVSMGFWKSNGTSDGTIQLKEINVQTGYNASENAKYFSVSNNILYFTAVKYGSGKGIELWKTNGTPAGTQSVKDINTYDSSYYNYYGPYYLTDVNGTLFFNADDGIHGYELWKSDGTNKGTQLVKDITPGQAGSYFNFMVSCAGKLFFFSQDSVWTSDGTAAGTLPIDDPVINDIQINNMVSEIGKLFISGYTHQYGTELYTGEVNNQGLITLSKMTDEKTAKITAAFDATLSPNPAATNTRLQLNGTAQNVSVLIRDINGKTLWQNSNINTKFINLPTERLAAGTYFVTVTNGKENKTIKLVKQ